MIEFKLKEIGEVLDYEQPTKYIVSSIKYDKSYLTPVLTAGKSFILGNTNEKNGVYEKGPVIIFDDFTTTSHFVNFKFKVKSSAMKMLTPKDKNIDLKYVYYFMQNINFNATMHKRYYLSRYSKIKIPVPSFSVQKKIVAILEKVENLKDKRKESNVLTSIYLESLFLEKFGDPKNPNNPHTFLGEIMNFKSGKAWKKEELSESGTKIVRISNLHNPNFKYWHTAGTIQEKYSVKKGDLLFSWAGVAKSIDVYIYDKMGAMLNQHIYNLILKDRKFEKMFVYYVLLLNLSKLRENLGGGVGQFHLKKGDVEKIKIPLIPLYDQKKFVDQVKKVEFIKEKQMRSEKELSTLFGALMQKAFKGVLVS
jgi:type I restriction enzyme, S subunit